MLGKASRACLRNSRHEPGEVDVLLNAGLYRTAFLSEPAIASLLAGMLKINDEPENQIAPKTLAFDVGNGALGFLNACYLATVLIDAEAAEHVLVAASEVENNAKPVPDSLRGVKETASAVMLDADHGGDEGFRAFRFTFFPEHEEALRVHGTAREWEVNGRHVARLHMEISPGLEDALIPCIVESVRDFLAEEDLTWDDIAAVLPPQIATGFITKLATALAVDPGRFIDVTCAGGDLFTSSLAYAFAAATAEPARVRRGDLGLIVNVASGIEVGCALYQF